MFVCVCVVCVCMCFFYTCDFVDTLLKVFAHVFLLFKFLTPFCYLCLSYIHVHSVQYGTVDSCHTILAKVYMYLHSYMYQLHCTLVIISNSACDFIVLGS